MKCRYQQWSIFLLAPFFIDKMDLQTRLQNGFALGSKNARVAGWATKGFPLFRLDS
jgi:hypothetical protein